LDWSRAKTVLIISFLLLNSLLAYQIWLNGKEQASSNPGLTGFSEETRAVMQEKNIRLEGAIPTETPELREISVQMSCSPAEGDRISLQSRPDSRVVFSPKEMKQALEKEIPDIDRYMFDPLLTSNRVFHLFQTYQGLPMFEVGLELYYNEQKIEAYRQCSAVVLEDSDKLKQKVLPAYKALANLIEKLQPGTVITDVRLGYHGQIFESDIQVLAPYWRVVVQNGDMHYIHAITGAV
jgi:regulatory protein YycI of two-component signal transduction system YycFG